MRRCAQSVNPGMRKIRRICALPHRQRRGRHKACHTVRSAAARRIGVNAAEEPRRVREPAPDGRGIEYDGYYLACRWEQDDGIEHAKAFLLVLWEIGYTDAFLSCYGKSILLQGLPCCPQRIFNSDMKYVKAGLARRCKQCGGILYAPIGACGSPRPRKCANLQGRISVSARRWRNAIIRRLP